MGSLFWRHCSPGSPSCASFSPRSAPSRLPASPFAALPPGVWALVRIPRCWSCPPPLQLPEAAVHPSRASLPAHCLQCGSQTAGDGEVLAGDKTARMDTKALSSVPCPPGHLSVPRWPWGRMGARCPLASGGFLCREQVSKGAIF